MAKQAKGEICPFCGELFATGIMRGHHVRAVHRTALNEILSDCDQAGLAERRFVSEEREGAANAS